MLACYVRGLDKASESELSRLSNWHLNATAVAAWAGETFDTHHSASIVALTPGKPHYEFPVPVGGTADLAALTHFLRPILEPAIKQLIAEKLGEGEANGQCNPVQSVAIRLKW